MAWLPVTPQSHVVVAPPRFELGLPHSECGVPPETLQGNIFSRVDQDRTDTLYIPNVAPYQLGHYPIYSKQADEMTRQKVGLTLHSPLCTLYYQ